MLPKDIQRACHHPASNATVSPMNRFRSTSTTLTTTATGGPCGCS